MSLTCEDIGSADVHSHAAKLSEEVIREYAGLLEHPERLCEILEKWKALMRAFREMERKTMIEKEPEKGQLESHLCCMNAMILCADTITQACQRYLEINCPTKETIPGDLAPLIDLLKRQRSFLAFEFKGWSPLPPELARKAEIGLLSDAGRKAA